MGTLEAGTGGPLVDFVPLYETQTFWKEAECNLYGGDREGVHTMD